MKVFLAGIALASALATPLTALANGNPKTFGVTTQKFTVEATQPVVCGFTFASSDFNAGVFDFNPGGYKSIDDKGKIDCNAQNQSVTLTSSKGQFSFLNYTGPQPSGTGNPNNMAYNINISKDGSNPGGSFTYSTTDADGKNTFSSPANINVFITRVNDSDAVLAGNYSDSFTVTLSTMTTPTTTSD